MLRGYSAVLTRIVWPSLTLIAFWKVTTRTGCHQIMVVATILVSFNLIIGELEMNVHVPGQDVSFSLRF